MGSFGFSDILFAQPSLMSGAARVLDLGSTFDYYNAQLTPNMVDSLAFKSDWKAIGNDIYRAITSDVK